jgi:chromosome segregation ATPase
MEEAERAAWETTVAEEESELAGLRLQLAAANEREKRSSRALEEARTKIDAHKEEEDRLLAEAESLWQRIHQLCDEKERSENERLEQSAQLQTLRAETELLEMELLEAERENEQLEATSDGLPSSPLAAYQALHQRNASLRTGYTHRFTGLAAGLNRAAAIEFRTSCRSGAHTGPTAGYADGFVQVRFV